MNAANLNNAMNQNPNCLKTEQATKPTFRPQDNRVTEDNDADQPIEHQASGPAPTRENPELSLKLALAAARDCGGKRRL